MQDTDFSKMWVGSLITSCNPNWEVTALLLEPSKVVIFTSIPVVKPCLEITSANS